jgi:signal transduction histidine kinase
VKAPGRTIAVTSVLSAVLVGAGIGVTISSYEVALKGRDSTQRAILDTRFVDQAETQLWQEREAMNEYLVTPRPKLSREVEVVRIHLERFLDQMDAENRLESRLIAGSSRANRNLVARFRSLRASAGQERLHALSAIGELDALARPVVSLLGRLRAGNDRVAARSDQKADAAGFRALIAGVLAGLIAFCAAAVFARYAVRLVRRIAHQNEELVELDQLKDTFVASVSHELRTPLTSIRGFLEVVLEGEAGELNEEQNELLRIVERNADRLLALVGDLLFVAQLDAGELELELRDSDLAEIAAGAVEGMRPWAEAKAISLDLETDPQLPIRADANRLGQLLDNLVSNAVKFTPEGGRIRVSARLLDNAAVLEVADTGIGIPARDQAQLFERFFRASTATEHAIQGTGLGLSISKAIAEAHEGRIAVESSEGKGTTFVVTLPLGGSGGLAAEVEQAA